MVVVIAVISWLPRATAGDGFIHAIEKPGGGELVDALGEPVHLRGVQVECWLMAGGPCWGGGAATDSEVYAHMARLLGPSEASQFRSDVYRTYVSDADIRRATQLGFNLIRVPINHTALDGDGQYGWKILDDLVSSAERYGLYVIFDLHAAPSPQSRYGNADYSSSAPQPTLWQPGGRRAETVALWRQIASRYRDRSAVAGYDLLNEPDTQGHSQQLVDLLRQIIAAIRTVDTNHLVIIEGDAVGSDLSAFRAPLDPNEAYSFHTYNHTGYPETDSQLRYFDGYDRTQGVPLLNGEFGQNTDQWVAETRAMFEDPKYMVSGWVYWNWKAVYNPGPLENDGLGYEHLVEEFQPTPAWQKTINYLTNPTPDAPGLGSPRPTPDEAAEGIREFLGSVAVGHTHETPSLLKALGSPSGR